MSVKGISQEVKTRGWVSCQRSGKRMIRVRLYSVWCRMRHRCRPKQSRRRHIEAYYKRGIRVCPQWSDYGTFRIWAISSGYRKGLSIDRIDNDGDYTPENCRWATAAQQSRNKRGVPLNEHMVRFIKRSGLPARELANRLDLRVSNVRDVLKGVTWADVS